MSSSGSDTDKFDPSRRRLCPDGACVGLLDEAGRCKVCGLTASGAQGDVPPPAPLPDNDNDDDFAEAGNEAVAFGLGADEPSEGGAFDPRRKLCPDGACVGVIGANGLCSVCGQAG